MKLLKLLKIAPKTTTKAQAQHQKLVIDIAESSNSCIAIARTVHPKAWTRWTTAEYKQLRTVVNSVTQKQNIKLSTSSLAQRRNFINAIASEIGRSPKAVVYRMKELNLIPNHIRFKL